MQQLRSASPTPAVQIGAVQTWAMQTKAMQTTATLASALLLPLILGVGALWQDAPQHGPVPATSFTISAGLT